MNTTLRRLMKEAGELSGSTGTPSPFFYAHPVSDSNFFEWHFTLAGPPEPSPYAKGIYHGRIVLPPQYPLRPPSFRFLTPSGRFEVNREICLSISGHHEESWQPAWGIRTALTALRSFMEADANGQVGGIDAKDEVRREWARKSKGWRCETCSGGRTNEEILKDWWEVCRAAGVEVDENNSTGAGGNSNHIVSSDPRSEAEGREASEKAATPAKVEYGGNTAQTQRPPLPRNSAVPISGSASDSNSPFTAQIERASNQRESNLRTSENPTPTNSSRRPSPTITTNSAPESFMPTRQPRRDANFNRVIWLDRAIISVMIALVIMILKKLFVDEPL